VLERIGTVAYRLALPPSSSVHLVFHVSLLKPAPSSKYKIFSALPDNAEGLQVPEALLQHRLHQRWDGSVAQVLVKWSGMHEDLATWEDMEAPWQKFPFAPA
jgi:hypothetical protein